MRIALAVALALTASLALGACLGGGPKPSFYALSSASDSSAPLAAKPELGLAVGPIEFPRYLDRPELVARDGANQLVVADAHRWGGSLRNEILRVVSDDLSRLLGTSRVVTYPTEPRFAANYRVLLDLREFERVAGGDVVLRVRWTVAALPGGSALVVEESSYTQPVASSSWNDVVAAESAALAALSHRIAERIAALH